MSVAPGPSPRAGLRVVANAISEAEPVTLEPTAEFARISKVALDPEPGDENGHGTGPGNWLPNRLGLPDDCPIRPLGYDRDTFYFLDTEGQLRALKDKDFGQKTLSGLFMGRHNYLFWGWPQQNKQGKITGWRAHSLTHDLMAACATKGSWNPTERVRGCGAWLGAKGDLIVHTGRMVWVGAAEREAGAEIGRYVYPKRPDVLAPWTTPVLSGLNPSPTLLKLFRTWDWARPEVDPVLLLGWIGAALIGGALPWRPMVYLTGDKGTGKSTLQETIKKLFGEGIISTTNTTAAGIYQRVGNDSLPVAIDEFEGKDDNRRAKAVLELARQASSGGRGMRGGDNNVGSEFSIRSAFLFSSINAPPLEPQDLSRMALLRLRKLNQDAVLKAPSDAELQQIGQRALRRMIDQWHRFHPTYQAYRDELKEAGHDQRGRDTFGVLLACADLLIGDQAEGLGVPMVDDLTPWRELLKAANMAEFEDAVENWRLCLSHLLTAPVDAWRNGAKLTIGRVIEQFYGDGSSTSTYQEVRDKLEQAGVAIQKPGERGGPHWLCIPNQTPLLHKLFLGTKWAGELGAGVWMQALRQAPRGQLWETGQARINGDSQRCTMISLAALYGDGGLMMRKSDVEAG